MSLPQTTRELAEQVMECRTWTKGIGLVDNETDAIALIDAYVRVREAQVLRDKLVDLYPRLQGQYSALRDFQVQIMQAEIKDAESGLATARKELEPERMQPAGEANDRS